MVDVRRELGRLILDGLMGRTLKQLFKQLRAAFHLAGEDVSATAFYSWAEGMKFPATRKRQDLIATVVGGPCGDAIAKLPGPAFRGYRRRVAVEEKTMTIVHGASKKGGWAARKFPTLSMVDDDGQRRSHPVITCVECGKSEVHKGRRGKLEEGELFKAKGWDVGDSAAYDVCPRCLEKRKVVVKMEDHVKKTEVQASAANSAVSKEDGRILSRLIEDHWDSVNNRYLPTYSDQRLATEVSRPVEWVREIRERDFGGVGEDPQLTDFLAATVVITEELAGLHGHMEGLAASVSELTSHHDKVQRTLEKYRDSHNVLADKVKHLREVAQALRPFDRKSA